MLIPAAFVVSGALIGRWWAVVPSPATVIGLVLAELTTSTSRHGTATEIHAGGFDLGFLLLTSSIATALALVGVAVRLAVSMLLRRLGVAGGGDRAGKASASGQPPEHQTTHRRVDEGLARGAQPLVVSAEVAILTESDANVRSTTYRRGSTPRNTFGAGGSRRQSNQTVSNRVRSPCGTHPPRDAVVVGRPPPATRGSLRWSSYRCLCILSLDVWSQAMLSQAMSLQATTSQT